MDFDIALTGFEDSEIADLFAGDEEDVQEDDFDEEAALEAEAFVESGDIWLLGNHRLMCGDSTKNEDVSLLMDGKKANLCVTDPPYNCAYKGGTGMTIMIDSWSDAEAFYNFLLDAFRNAYGALADGAAIYIFHSDAEKVNFFNATVNAGFHYSTTWMITLIISMLRTPLPAALDIPGKHPRTTSASSGTALPGMSR